MNNKSNKRKLLIIGGSGFVSSHLAQKALSYGLEVWVVTRGNKPVPLGVIPLKADRSDHTAFKNTLEAANVKWDAVLDCICMNAADASQDIDVFTNLAKQLIIISTDIVYEPSARRFPQSEENDKWLYEGYAGNKRLCELEFIKAGTGVVPWTILRPGHIFGPGSELGCLPLHQRDPELIEKLVTQKTISLVGGGHFLLHPIFVDDLCALMIDVVGKEEAYNQIFCVGGPDVLECRKYYEIIASILQVDIKIEAIPVDDYLPSHPDAVPSVCHRIYDLSKLKTLGVTMPSTPIEDGLRQHVEAILEKNQNNY